MSNISLRYTFYPLYETLYAEEKTEREKTTPRFISLHNVRRRFEQVKPRRNKVETQERFVCWISVFPRPVYPTEKHKTLLFQKRSTALRVAVESR